MLISGAPVTASATHEKVGVVAAPSVRAASTSAASAISPSASRNGVVVPLQQIAKIEYSHEEPILWRRNRDMANTVRTDVVDGVQGPTSPNRSAELQDHSATISSRLRIEPGARTTQ